MGKPTFDYLSVYGLVATVVGHHANDGQRRLATVLPPHPVIVVEEGVAVAYKDSLDIHTLNDPKYFDSSAETNMMVSKHWRRQTRWSGRRSRTLLALGFCF